MAQKKITELQLRSGVTVDLNFPTDDGIQSYRVTGEQLRQFFTPTTTRGDLVAGDANGKPARVGAGTSGYYLKTKGITGTPEYDNACPVGSINLYAGSTTPGGWLFCDGTAVSRTTYADLFATIGTVYGTGDGSTTFNLPDTRGIFIRGAGSQTISGTQYDGVLGTKQRDQFQGHHHQQRVAPATPQGGSAGPTVDQLSATPSSVRSGGNGVQEAIADSLGNGTPRVGTQTHPANISLNYIIKF